MYGICTYTIYNRLTDPKTSQAEATTQLPKKAFPRRQLSGGLCGRRRRDSRDAAATAAAAAL